MKNKVSNAYKQAERFAEITKKSILIGNIGRAKRFLNIAEKIFETGSSETKNIISNVFVYSVSSFIELRNCSISNLFPKLLKAEYLKQINNISV